MFTGDYSYVVPMVGAVATLLIGLLVLWHGRKQLQAKILALFVLVLSLWLFGTAFMFMHCDNSLLALRIDRFIYLVVSAMPPVVFHFVTTIVRIPHARELRIFGYALMFSFWFLIWSPLFVNDLYQYSNGCHARAGWLHHVFLVYFIGFSVIILTKVFRTYRETPKSERKTQLQFIFLALASQVVVGTSAFLSAYNINSIGFSYFSGILTILILVYAMFRHNLLELRVIAMKIFTTLAIAANGFQVFLVEDTTLRIVNGVVFVLICTLGILVTRNVREEIENREKGERLARYLANANARLRELDKQKTEFVSVASHQLRSPIAAIKGYASLIREGSYGAVPKKLTEPLSRIEESGTRIAIMVDDFLNVTRIEQGRMSYSMERHDICKLVSRVVEELVVITEKKGLKLELVHDKDAAIYVVADKGKLTQIFSNLIDNAIKYTQKGGIRITFEKFVKQKVVLIKITDTGIGIAPEEQPILFQKFNRASNANSTNVLGTGLGLYIAREIIKAHKGWIHVSSPGVGKGSTFSVELPLADSQEEKADKNTKNKDVTKK